MALRASAPAFLTYLLSFMYVGIYWNNHHHMFQLVERVDGGVLWANLHLLFWLSLFPFTTAWMDESAFARTPVVVYGFNLLLQRSPTTSCSGDLPRRRAGSRLRQAIGRTSRASFPWSSTSPASPWPSSLPGSRS